MTILPMKFEIHCQHQQSCLSEEIYVLCNDLVLRKLFFTSSETSPTRLAHYKAASGETALDLVDAKNFHHHVSVNHGQCRRAAFEDRRRYWRPQAKGILTIYYLQACRQMP